ncbi:MAG: phosphate ABC transporter permease PstA [Gammaproteobacteria bacterium]
MFCGMVTWSGVLLLAILLYQVSIDGFRWLDWQFIDSFPSRFPERAGIKSALVGTIWLISLVALISIPVGVSTALYLEEFAGKGKISKIIEVNIANLAGVPSIVYGILGLAIFVRYMALERSLVSGALTMSLLILPVIIIASREAIKTVPMSIRYAAYSLGATKWQTAWAHVLPASFPGIMTGVILALSRAIGETAPLIMIGALTFVAFLPEGPMDSFTALPIQIYNWVSRPQQEFHELAAAGIIILLTVLLLMNATAIYIRNKTERRLK